MAKRDKLVQKMLQTPTEMRFEEVERVLSSYGFFTTTKGTSHRVYKDGKGKRLTLAIKHGQVVKREYLKAIISVLELEE